MFPIKPPEENLDRPNGTRRLSSSKGGRLVTRHKSVAATVITSAAALNLSGCYSRYLTHSNGMVSKNGWSINLIGTLVVLGIAYATIQNDPQSKKLKMFWGAWAGGFLGALPFVMTGTSGANPGLETLVSLIALGAGVAAGAVWHDGELRLQ